MKRRIVAAAMFAAPLAVVAVACSFPEVTFVGADGGVGTDVLAPTGDGSTSDASVRDAETRSDAELRLDAASCEAATRCDCDEDGYADKKCPVDASSILSKKNVPLKPDDCDDLDRLRFPGAPKRSIAPEPGQDGDWDCSGTVERDPPGNFTCTGIGLNCQGTAGFKGEPACGSSEPFYTCVAPSITSNCIGQPGASTVEYCK